MHTISVHSYLVDTDCILSLEYSESPMLISFILYLKVQVGVDNQATTLAICCYIS